MARWFSRSGFENGVLAGAHGVGAAMVVLAAVWQAPAVNAAPLLAQAGAALVAPDAAKAAKPVNPVANVPGAKMAENFANAPAGGAAPAPAAAPASGGPGGSVSATLLKYAPSYVVMALSIALGTFIICRPKPGAKAK